MAFQPMPLSRKPAPFDHPEWVFELKYDGFPSLAVIQNGCAELISPNGNSFKSFELLRKELKLPCQGKTTEFFQKSDSTSAEIQEFEWAGERIRKLFAEMEQLNKAA